MSRVLLITLAVGYYTDMYDKFFRTSHEEYAKKHGYDFKVLTTSLAFPNYFCLTFTKMLVCSQDFSSNYDFIIFVDADILINKNSPALHTAHDYKDKIGIVDTNYGMIEEDGTAYYKRNGYDLETNMILNTGLLVFQPTKHKELLEDMYNKHVHQSINHSQRFQFENATLGYYLQKNNMYHLLDRKWNTIWYEQKMKGISLQQCYDDNYFIHFAGNCDFYSVPQIKR